MMRILKDYPSVTLNPKSIEGRIDFTHIFGRSAPVHIEIGSGKGTFLINEAKAKPHINFLGIEWARKYYRYAVDRIGRWGLTNIRMIRTDAVAFIRDYINDNTIECLHVYFPDPWPKKRHHKRRLFCPFNVGQLIRILKVNGQIRVATDHAEYFEEIRKHLLAPSDIITQVLFHPTAGSEAGEWVGTNFERKYLKEERSVFTIAVKKNASVSCDLRDHHCENSGPPNPKISIQDGPS
jgi:tRNA (guanine-N7-)-methyltransferase